MTLKPDRVRHFGERPKVAGLRPALVAWLMVSTMTEERDEACDVPGFLRAVNAEDEAMTRLTQLELIAVRREALGLL